jgi:hypothetical protein
MELQELAPSIMRAHAHREEHHREDYRDYPAERGEDDEA